MYVKAVLLCLTFSLYIWAEAAYFNQNVFLVTRGVSVDLGNCSYTEEKIQSPADCLIECAQQVQCKAVLLEGPRIRNWCCFLHVLNVDKQSGNHVIYHKPEVNLTCHQGWQEPDCDTCAQGFTGAVCDSCMNGLTGNACSECIVGVGWEAPDCTSCKTGLTGVGCDLCTAGVGWEAPDCTSCKSGLNGTGCNECVVGVGWEAPDCDRCKPGLTGDNCDQCTAGVGWEVPYCNTCGEGWQGSDCNICKFGFDFSTDCTTCLQHGQWWCVLDNGNTQHKYNVTVSFEGDMCSTVTPGGEGYPGSSFTGGIWHENNRSLYATQNNSYFYQGTTDENKNFVGHCGHAGNPTMWDATWDYLG